MTGLLYIALALVLFVVSIMYSFTSVHIAFVICIMIGVSFFVLMIFNRLLIKYETSLGEYTILKGDKISYKITLKNKSIFPSGDIKTYIEVHYGDVVHSKKILISSVMPMSTSTYAYEFETEYSGNVTIVRKKVVLCDYGKIFKIKLAKKNVAFNAVVMPQAFPIILDYTINANNELIEAEKYHDSKKGSDRTEIFNIREYVPGDQMKDVHWKMTSKMDKYMVKEYSLPISRNVDIILDISQENNNVSKKNMLDIVKVRDKKIEILYSLGLNFLMNQSGFVCHIIDQKKHLYVDHSVDSEDEFVAIVGMSVEKNMQNHLLTDFGIGDMFDNFKGDYIVYITSFVSEELIKEVANQTDKKIILIYVKNKNTDKSNMGLEGLPYLIEVILVDADSVGMGDIHEIKF